MAFKTKENPDAAEANPFKNLRIKHDAQEKEERLDEIKVIEGDRIMGSHVFGNLYKIDKEVAGNLNSIKKIIEEAAGAGNMRIVEIKAFSFGENRGGVTAIAIMQVGHIALHTWLEYNYATLDVYTSGTMASADKAFDYVVSKLKPRRHQKFRADRSQVEL